jgi:hypothetical protein
LKRNSTVQNVEITICRLRWHPWYAMIGLSNNYREWSGSKEKLQDHS